MRPGYDDDRADEALAARAIRRRDQAEAAEFERTGWPVGEAAAHAAEDEAEMDAERDLRYVL